MTRQEILDLCSMILASMLHLPQPEDSNYNVAYNEGYRTASLQITSWLTNQVKAMDDEMAAE